jgi:dihydrofolate reductase
MRKLIVTNIVSLDGYHEGPGRNVMSLPMDDSFDTHNVERLRAADTLLLGRTTYQLFEGFWPRMADRPEATPANRELSRLNGAIQKVVVSDTLSADEKSPWRSTTRIVRRADARQLIADLKRGPGRDILVFGSRTLWNQLLVDGLVDELHIMMGAVVLGAGTPAFGNGWSAPLRLLDTRRWEGSNNVLLRYACS